MARGPRKLKISRQQENVVLLAIFCLKYDHSQDRPKKRQVLNYVKLKKLIQIREDDLEVVSSGEPSWENDLAWRREDLTTKGEIYMPETGIWQITKEGEIRLLKWCAILSRFTESRPAWADHLKILELIFEEKIVITSSTVEFALKAYSKAYELYPEADFSVPIDLDGKLQL